MTLDERVASFPSRKSRRDKPKMRAFLTDLAPFFRDEHLVYVDAGAYDGGTAAEVFASPLAIEEAHLVEPNPVSFGLLQEMIGEIAPAATVTCHNLALAERPGRLRLTQAMDLSRVVADDEGPSVAEVESLPLDDLAAGFGRQRISLLKIDVEGYEAQVLAGARRLLEDEAIDVVYIEAGLDPEGNQQTYYRQIEDILASYGYRLFRIYEQVHDWTVDSPLLRRVNLAFMSSSFANRHPYRLSRDLFSIQKERDALRVRVGELETAMLAAEADLLVRSQALEREREAAAQRAEMTREEGKARDKHLRAAEARAAEVGEGKARAEAERARAEAKRSRAEAERASALKRLDEVRAALLQAQREERVLTDYTRDLEKKHSGLLRSSSWRAMEPVRRLVRLLRRKPAPTSFVPRLQNRRGPSPKRSQESSGAETRKTGSIRQPREKVAKQAKEMIAHADNRRLPELIAMRQALAGNEHYDDGLFLSVFTQLLALKRMSSFTEAAALVDLVLTRFDSRGRRLIKVVGRTAYLRFVCDASIVLTRVGRYAEGRSLVDEAIKRLPEQHALLGHRAEICWPYDPAQARRDLSLLAERGAIGRGDRLLRAYLETCAPECGSAASVAASGHREEALVAATAALNREDFAAYRTSLNGFFNAQGLAAPLPSTLDRFAFRELAAKAPPEPSGSKVSVIMTTYNCADTVAFAARSILAQSQRDLELLIVDDHSTDGTQGVLAEIAASDARVRVLETAENVGTYCAKNQAMAVTTGDFVTFHDSDDWAHPERLARHLRAMAADPDLVATRSEWLRIDPDGAIQFRRWGRRFQHPNPASLFIRREVTEAVGFFDDVRFGADSEYWFRIMRVFGRKRVRSLPVCLGLGMLHEASLTRSGSGAMDVENYAPVRGAYASAYLNWHATAPPEALKRPLAGGDRPFPVPTEMAVQAADISAHPLRIPPVLTPSGTAAEWIAAAGPAPARQDVPEQTAEPEPEIMFGISLASRRTSADWPRTVELLGHTLHSLLNQSDGRFTVAIGGHERPDIAELDDPRVLFVECTAPPPKGPEGFRRDKMLKRRLVGAVLRARGGGYFFPLDADDLVHRDVVAHVRADDNRRGYLIDRGYALDYANGVLAPIPGAWSVPFDRVCGSSALIYFRPEELPRDGELEPELHFNLFQSHAYWPIIAEEFGRPLAPLPFPGGVYVVNHAQNLSFKLQRAGTRTKNIIEAIARNRIEKSVEVLRREFGTENPVQGKLRACPLPPAEYMRSGTETSPNLEPPPRYARGYLLTDLAVDPPVPGWLHNPLGSLHLYHDPRSSLTSARHGRCSVTVLGLVIDTHHPEASAEETVHRACRALAENEGHFLEVLNGWGGRHLVVFDDGERVHLCTDATGMRTAFYATASAHLYVASHAKMIADILKVPPDPRLEVITRHPAWGTNRAKYLPGAMTPWKNVEFLTANTMLRLSDRAIRRFWPRHGPPDLSFKESAKIVSEKMRAQLSWLRNQNRPLVCSLTRGLDSRATLAVAKEIKDNIAFFTYLRPGSSIDEKDAHIAQEIANSLALNYNIIRVNRKPLRSETENTLEEINFIPHKWSVAEAYLGTFSPETIHIRSNVAEIGRIFWNKDGALPKDFTARELARTWRKMDDLPEALDAFQEWGDKVGFWEIEGYDKADMAYWEHRMSCWHGCIVLESDIAFDSVSLFNQRELLTALLGVSRAERATAKAFFEIIKMHSSELLRWPVNGVMPDS